MLHVAWSGPQYWISVGTKVVCFEDHRHCGPIVLCNKTGEPLDKQPDDRDKFWLHYEAWAKQGKKTNTIDGKAWCDYKTELQAWRRRIAAHHPTN